MRWTPLLLLLTACSEYDVKAKDEVDGVGPEITVDPLEISFGVLSDGETTKSETISITNEGDADLEVSLAMIEVVDGTTATFTFDPTSFVIPNVLPPGESQELTVIYTSEDTSDEGLVRIVSNDADETEVQVPLYGGYVVPKLLIDPPVMDFGSRMLNCYDSDTFTLTNIGGDTLSLDAVYLDNEDFVIAEGYPELMELEPGMSTEVLVEFNPEAVGSYDGNLVVESNDPEGTKMGIIMGSGDDLGECQALSIEAIVEYEIADIAFIFDTTCSMGPTSTAIAGEFSAIAAALQDEIDDVSFGVATFKDYHYAGYGGAGDLPFFLEQQITSDLTRVQNALGGPNMGASGGADWEESSFEALYQAAAGTGYDQDCDGEYDEDFDVLPFNRSNDDVFYGNESGTYTAGLPDSGELGGMGFREDVLPVFILATDAPMRDPLNSYPIPPQACSWQEGTAASSDAAVLAVGDLEGGMIGVAVNSGSGYVAEAAMIEAGMLTVQWSQSSSSEEFRDTIVEAVKSLIGTAVFDRVWLKVASDPYGMVDAVTPNEWTNVPSGDSVSFTVEVSSAIVNEPSEDTYTVLLEMYGEIDDENWLLNSYIYYVLIPESEE